jgi:anti-sigma B factor antagonist
LTGSAFEGRTFVPLSLQTRRVGDVAVVTCVGRIVEGPESVELHRQLDRLIEQAPDIVLHLGGIEFMDSGGLGLLVRCRTRALNANGHLRICAASEKVVGVLKATRLHAVFQPYDTEADAITDAHRTAAPRDASFLNAAVLCVDPSSDVLAYLRELLKEAGFRVVDAQNLPDALILLHATRPKAIVIAATLRAVRETRAAEEFNRLADALAVVELPSEFSRQDAGDAAESVLGRIRALVDPAD